MCALYCAAEEGRDMPARERELAVALLRAIPAPSLPGSRPPSGGYGADGNPGALGSARRNSAARLCRAARIQVGLLVVSASSACMMSGTRNSFYRTPHAL